MLLIDHFAQTLMRFESSFYQTLMLDVIILLSGMATQ